MKTLIQFTPEQSELITTFGSMVTEMLPVHI